jgi:hypothetical protein
MLLLPQVSVHDTRGAVSSRAEGRVDMRWYPMPETGQKVEYEFSTQSVFAVSARCRGTRGYGCGGSKNYAAIHYFGHDGYSLLPLVGALEKQAVVIVLVWGPSSSSLEGNLGVPDRLELLVTFAADEDVGSRCLVSEGQPECGGARHFAVQRPGADERFGVQMVKLDPMRLADYTVWIRYV